MKIKYKFTIAILLIFLFNSFLLLSFYGGYLYPNISNEVIHLQEQIETTITQSIQDKAQSQSLVEDLKEQVFLNDFTNTVSKIMIQKILFFEIIVFLFILLITSILTFYRYVNPIDELTQSMDNYRRGLPPKKMSVRNDEIGNLQREFLTLIQSVDTEKQKQNQIIASISHDVKTPLTSIMGYVERLLKKNFPKEKEKEYLHTIYAKAQTINELINEFDEYISYNIESPLLVKNYEISEICQMIQAEYAQELSDIGVNFFVQNLCQPTLVAIDMLKFKRVIGNLISNSIKHMEATPSIFLTCTSSHKGVLFRFRDNGCGIADSDLPYIFDPLYTSDKSRKVAGLGLSICKNIVLAHGGTITAKNSTQSGLEIEIFMHSA